MSNILDMDAKVIDLQMQRGLAIVQTKGRRIRQIAEGKYLVPSQTLNSGGYVVDTQAESCTCPEFELRGCRCKHLWAVRIIRNEPDVPVGLNAVKEHRITYRQDWPRYNAAQMDEKSCVEQLLRGLCDGIESPPPPRTGRPPSSLADVIYAATLKTYVGMSGRRATSDVRECESRGLLSDAPHYNTIFRYMERPEITPLLKRLVEQSALPLRAIENKFAIDSTGFSTSVYGRWFDHKYNEERTYQQYVKAHVIVGTVTNVIVAVEATEGQAGDGPMLPTLLERAAKWFEMAELSGDKAYLSHENLASIASIGATPYIAFKSNSTEDSKGQGAETWTKMWHLFNLERETYLEHYHQRSNVESTFSAVKRLLGTSVRAKLPTAQYNEVYLKCLAFNLTRLVKAIHLLGINPKFWTTPPMEKCA